MREERVQQVDPINEFHATIDWLIEQSGMASTYLRAIGFAPNTLNWASKFVPMV
ncbi:hypothetical protein [Dictyobacter aurantiacus]|uniref:hypothetical protein n=1 Tax=Dictyobacter aurantiacus TaxID=1936993 RepID=UPI001359076D|nr:hypothetical protein [Dictyobacter aurantiacus]